MKSEIQEFLKYRHNEQPKCPHCDEDIDIDKHELYELYQDDDHHITCPECNKDICVHASAKWTFTTAKDDI